MFKMQHKMEDTKDKHQIMGWKKIMDENRNFHRQVYVFLNTKFGFNHIFRHKQQKASI